MELLSTVRLSLPELHDLFRRCFEGYVVSVQFELPQFVERMRVDGVDFEASRLILESGAPVGVMFVARRGAASRLAAMGIVSAARHRGLGTHAVSHLLDEARMRGDHSMVLEVIEQNPTAVALYRSAGFSTVRRLLGFRSSLRAEAAPPDLEPVDVREFTQTLAAHGPRDLPWQMSWESFANVGWPHRAVRQGPVWALLADPGQGPVALKAMVVESSQRRQGRATAFLQGLRGIGRELRVSAIVPEEPGAALFATAGWEREEISQWEMRADLEGS